MSAILEVSEENLSNGHNVISMENDDILLDDSEVLDKLDDSQPSVANKLSTNDDVLKDDTSNILENEKLEDDTLESKNSNYTTDNLITAYSKYLKAISVLPIGVLDELNKAYLTFTEVFKSIPFNLLEKLKNDLSKTSSDNIYFNDYMKKLNFDLIDLFGSLQAFYDFSVAFSMNNIGKVLYSYNYYKETLLKIPTESLESVACAYKEFKKIEKDFSKDVLLSLNIVVPINNFLDEYFTDSDVILDEKETFKEDNKFILDNLENFSDSIKEYSVSNDINVKDNFTIVVPHLEKEDFTKIIMNRSLESVSPNELCSNNGKIIFDSCNRVKDNLVKEANDIYRLKGYVDNSLVGNQLSMSVKLNLSDYLLLQVNLRINLVKKLEKDLVNGWNKINGSIGVTLDPTWSNTDAYGVYETAVKCAYSYKDEFVSIVPFMKILEDVNSYGFDIRKDYFE